MAADVLLSLPQIPLPLLELLFSPAYLLEPRCCIVWSAGLRSCSSSSCCGCGPSSLCLLVVREVHRRGVRGQRLIWLEVLVVPIVCEWIIVVVVVVLLPELGLCEGVYRGWSAVQRVSFYGPGRVDTR
jgi:hypothetical protein